MKRMLALGVILLVFVVACGKKEVKKETADSKVAVEAFTLAEKLRTAYLNKDVGTFRQNASDIGFAGFMKGRKHFDSAELTFSPMLTEIEGDKVLLYVSWNGTWQVASRTTEDRGLAVFVFRERPLKLDQVLRSNPFTQPE